MDMRKTAVILSQLEMVIMTLKGLQKRREGILLTNEFEQVIKILESVKKKIEEEKKNL